MTGYGQAFMQRGWPTRTTRSLILACALAGFTLPATVIAAGADDLAAAKAGTEGLRDVASAEAAGYALPSEGPLHECIGSFDDTGAMGLHYINGDLVGDTDLDPSTPDVTCPAGAMPNAVMPTPADLSGTTLGFGALLIALGHASAWRWRPAGARR